jgi:outer membrane murein-binding lipoprotein Lpp
MTRHLAGILTVVALLAAGGTAVLTGCSSMQAYDPAGGTDQDIASDVQERLRNDAITARQVISVQCEQGIVTLAAPIYNETVRARALAIARGTPGVKSVVDNTTR